MRDQFYNFSFFLLKIRFLISENHRNISPLSTKSNQISKFPLNKRMIQFFLVSDFSPQPKCFYCGPYSARLSTTVKLASTLPSIECFVLVHQRHGINVLISTKIQWGYLPLKMMSFP